MSTRVQPILENHLDAVHQMATSHPEVLQKALRSADALGIDGVDALFTKLKSIEGGATALLDDMARSDELLEAIAREPGLVNAWSDLATIGKKIDGVPQGHALRLNPDFLKKYSSLDTARKNKLKNYLNEQKAFSGRKGEVSYYAERNIDIGDGTVRTYRIDYDEYGFPKFEEYCPNGFNANESDLVSYFTSGKSNLDGGSNDFTAANNWLKNKFPDKEITSTSTGFKLRENGIEIEYTWHHHQNGKDIFPVPRAIHNTRTTVDGSNYFGFPHSGGAALVKTDPAIRGFFPDPKF